jgi:hypothetical protein
MMKRPDPSNGLAIGAVPLDVGVNPPVGTARQLGALVQFGLQLGEIGRVVGDEAGLVLMDGDDDRAAVLAVGTRGVLGQRGAQGVGDGDATFVVHQSEASPLIKPSIRHAALASGAGANHRFDRRPSPSIDPVSSAQWSCPVVDVGVSTAIWGRNGIFGENWG